MKKHWKFCPKCDRFRTFKVGKRFYRSGKGKKTKFFSYRERDNCMTCGWTDRRLVSKRLVSKKVKRVSFRVG